VVPDNPERAQEYRAIAYELLEQAKTTQFPDLKAEFLQLAERYGRLAERLEGDPLSPDPDGFVDGILGTA
jgi:hypothetical protein